MQNFTIREYVHDDFELVFQIWLDSQARATGKTIPASAINSHRSELKRLFCDTPNTIIYVAVSPLGRVIGWQSIMPLLSNPFLSKFVAQSSTYVEEGNL